MSINNFSFTYTDINCKFREQSIAIIYRLVYALMFEEYHPLFSCPKSYTVLLFYSPVFYQIIELFLLSLEVFRGKKGKYVFENLLVFFFIFRKAF